MSVRKRLEKLEQVSESVPILALPKVEFYSEDGKLIYEVSGLGVAPDEFSEKFEPVIFFAKAKIDGLEDINVERFNDEDFENFSTRLDEACEKALGTENKGRFLSVFGWRFAWH